MSPGALTLPDSAHGRHCLVQPVRNSPCVGISKSPIHRDRIREPARGVGRDYKKQIDRRFGRQAGGARPLGPESAAHSHVSLEGQSQGQCDRRTGRRACGSRGAAIFVNRLADPRHTKLAIVFSCLEPEPASAHSAVKTLGQSSAFFPAFIGLAINFKQRNL